jgi:hypothetical protein
MRPMTRLVFAFVLGIALVAGARNPAAAQGSPPPASPGKPLDEFVPKERVPADADVPFPVDI